MRQRLNVELHSTSKGGVQKTVGPTHSSRVTWMTQHKSRSVHVQFAIWKSHEHHVKLIYGEALLGTKQRALSFARCFAESWEWRPVSQIGEREFRNV